MWVTMRVITYLVIAHNEFTTTELITAHKPAQIFTNWHRAPTNFFCPPVPSLVNRRSTNDSKNAKAADQMKMATWAPVRTWYLQANYRWQSCCQHACPEWCEIGQEEQPSKSSSTYKTREVALSPISTFPLQMPPSEQATTEQRTTIIMICLCTAVSLAHRL